MEQKALIERLAEIEKHIASGKLHIERQQELTDELVKNGEPVRTSVHCLPLSKAFWQNTKRGEQTCFAL